MGKPSQESMTRKLKNKRNSSTSKMKRNSTTCISKKKRMKENKVNNRRRNSLLHKVYEISKRKSKRNYPSANSPKDKKSTNSIIVLEDTQEETVKPVEIIDLEDNTLIHDQKHKKRKNSKCDTIILNNDSNDECDKSIISQNLSLSFSEVSASTPKAKKKKLSDTSNIDTTKQANTDSSAQNQNKTHIVNPDSYLTIDLTTNTENAQSSVSIVNLSDVRSVSSTSIDSEVTVISTGVAGPISSQEQIVKNINKLRKGIAKMDSFGKQVLLEKLTNEIFTGCNVTRNKAKLLSRGINTTTSRATNAPSDPCLSRKPSATPLPSLSENPIGTNIYNPNKKEQNSGLRLIVIDGSNVAMEHGRGKQFSCEGLQICIEYFLRRGHDVRAFVPRFRCKWGKSSNPRLLDALQRRGLVVYTPSRTVQGRHLASYDDRYILQCAAELGGVVVSGDNYRDLAAENPAWRRVVDERLLPFTWVGDLLMFPQDPLGRQGPSLDELLRHPPPSV